MERIRIAILADYPAWEITDRIPKSGGHYAVWLSALYHTGAFPEHWDIHWIVLSPGIENGFTVDHGNHHFHLLRQQKLSIGLVTGYWHDRRTIRRAVSQIKPHLVHAWGSEKSYALAGADFPGKRILSMQGILTAYCQRSKMPWFYRIQQYWERRAIRRYPLITTESPWGHDRLRELSATAEIRLIEYGVEEPFSHIEKHLSEKPVCIYAGTISDTKGSETLVEAFSSPKLAHIQLKIAGSGSLHYVQKLRDKATPNILFMGRVSRQNMITELSSAWCLVHPTLADTSPNIVKEARCAGTPVISTPEGGQTQYIENGVSGYIVPVNNAQAIIEAVLCITRSAEHAREMGKNGQQECQRELRPELTAARLVELYRELLEA